MRSRPGPPPIVLHRGPILIHASKGVGTIGDFDSAVEDILWVRPDLRDRIRTEVATMHGTKPFGLTWRPRPNLARGAIVGRARATGHVEPAAGSPYFVDCSDDDLSGIDLQWWSEGFALVLADVEAFPEPIPCNGTLGLWPPRRP